MLSRSSTSISEFGEVLTASRARRGFGPRAAKLALQGVALALYTLVFAEVFLSLLRPQALMPRYITATPWGVRGNIPNADYWHWTPETRTHLRINAQRMRDDRAFTLLKPPGTCRVALFGDSFFVGYELDLEDAFAFKLEAALRRRGLQVELLNFAVSGFGTAEMIRTYGGYARNFDPDLVLFQWHFTDFDDNTRSKLFKLTDEGLRPDHPSYLPSVGLQDALMEYRFYRLIADNSQLYSFVRERLGRLVKRLMTPQGAMERPAPAGEGTTPLDDEVTGMGDPEAVELSAALLTYAQDAVAADGRDFMVIEVPRRVSRTVFASTIEVLPEATRQATRIVQPVEAFRARAAPNRKLFYEQGHRHLSPEGVDLMISQALDPVAKTLEGRGCRATASE